MDFVHDRKLVVDLLRRLLMGSLFDCILCSFLAHFYVLLESKEELSLYKMFKAKFAL